MKNNEMLEKKIKELEEENSLLKQIIAYLPSNIFWENKDGVYMGCNRSVVKLLKLSSEADIVGKTVYDFADPELARNVDKTDKRIMKEKKEVMLEEEGFDTDRKPATYLSMKAPLLDNNRNVMGLLCVSMDITKIKAAELALIEAKNKAEETNRIKSEFIYTVEHDIRAPFAGIHAMSSLLSRQETDPDKKEALESIATSSKASLDYATRLLSFAKIEEDFKQIVEKPFSVRELVQSVIEIQVPSAQTKGLKLEQYIAADIPDKIVSDPERLKSILINLVNNAIKFTAQGFVKIEVSAIKKKSGERKLKFSVRDTGVGLTPGKQYFINENFFRANHEPHGLLPGFGLGFPVIKKFISDLRGEIKIKSVEGKGTVIAFTIPFQVAA